MLPQLAVEQAGVHTGAQRDGERQTRVRADSGRMLESSLLQGQDEHGIHHLGGDQGQDGDPYGRGNILPRVKARRQYLDENQPEQPRAVGDQRLARHPEVVLAELPVVKQGRDEWHREQGQCDGRRRREDERQAQAPVEQPRILALIRGRVILRQARQENRPERHAQERGRKFHEAVGVVEPGDAAVPKERRDDRIDQEADLSHGNAEHGRPHQ